MNIGNEITEILVLPVLPEWKPIVAMALPKMGGKKKKRKRIVTTKLPKMEGKKKDAIFTTFLHHFHNKLQVVSCYWFKFEPNTTITLLPQ